MPADLNVIHADALAIIHDHGLPRTGSNQGELDLINDGAIAIRKGHIVAVGTTADVLEKNQACVPTIDAKGRTVLPGPGNFVNDEYMGASGYGASGWLPLSFTMGYTIINSIDLFVGFTMTNLAPEGSINPADGKSLTIGLDYRF